MSSLSVIVLALNGRKQRVKCTPNTTILQILEEVCKKQELNSHEYDVKHHNKILDTTMTFRFSGLPNNAQLELTPALKNRNESSIILAINFEDGRRVTDTFAPSNTFLDVLRKCCPDNALPEHNPVVIYTRREISGKDLETTTLRNAGITGGRAMIRVLNKSPELLRQQANISTALPIKPTEEKPFVRKFQPLYVDNIKDYKQQEQQMETDDEKENIKVIDTPTFAQAEKRRLSSEEEEQQRKMFNPNQNLEQMDTDNPTIVDNPTTTNKINEDEFIFCGERNGMIFSLESAQSVHTDDLPDEFFELTIDDAKMIFRDLKKKRYDLENQLMKTSRLRDLEEKEKQEQKLKKYKRAIIRIQFSDRTVIQGTFQPEETVQDILDFIRSYLSDPNLDFYVYCTPPKFVLDRHSRLIDIGCVPGALLHFGCDQDCQGSYLKDEFRRMFTTTSAASLAAARIRQQNTNKINEKSVYEDIPDMDTSSGNNAMDQMNHGASTSTNDGNRRITSSPNMPKWFKPM